MQKFVAKCKKKLVILSVYEKSDREGKCVTGDLAVARLFVK